MVAQDGDLTTGTIDEIRKERYEEVDNRFPSFFHQERKATSDESRKFISIDFKKCLICVNVLQRIDEYSLNQI